MFREANQKSQNMFFVVTLGGVYVDLKAKSRTVKEIHFVIWARLFKTNNIVS